MNRSMKALGALSVIAFGAFALVAPQNASTPVPQHGAGAAPAQNRHQDLPETQPPNPRLYERLKASANARRGIGHAVAVGGSAPVATLKKQGVDYPNLTPSDSNGAIGTTRYMETTNDQIGLYDTSLNKISQFNISALSQSSDTFAFDPDVTWDPKTKKFYFVTLTQAPSGSAWTLHMGFSKNASPSSAADFCVQHFPNGNNLPDYPKIGGTTNFSLVGVNNYTNAQTYTGSSVYWMKKPGSAPITTCPTQATGSGSGFQFSTVPAQQTDPSATGYMLSSTWSGGSTIQQYTVTGSTSPTFTPAGAYSVTPYSIPANAPQSNGRYLDTLDNRMWQVQQSFDPRLNLTVLWSSLTTFGGPGAAVEWFELSPATTTPAQQGVVSSATLYVFNGSISSDRRYRSSTVNSYGSAMVLGFNTASATSDPAIRVVSKIGTAARSAFVRIVQSPGPDMDYTCPNSGNTCRWGDYSSMTASPISPTGAATGQVWGTNMWDSGLQNAAAAHWRTENWLTTP
jgi:hypothetical protein